MFFISSLSGLAWRKHVESPVKPRNSTSVLEALPGKQIDIKLHSPSILYLWAQYGLNVQSSQGIMLKDKCIHCIDLNQYIENSKVFGMNITFIFALSEGKYTFFHFTR